MHPLALTIAALVCLAGGFQGRGTELSARHPAAVAEPESPGNAIAFITRAGSATPGPRVRCG